MKYVKEYLETVVKIKPLGELTTRDEQELNGLSGEMVYIDGKCSDIFISHADYANWLEKQKPKVNVTKFKPGDKVTNGISTYIIDSIEDGYYRCKDGVNITFTLEYRWEIVEDEHKPAEWHREDEQNLNACLGYIPDEFLRKWLRDVIHIKYDKPADNVEELSDFENVMMHIGRSFFGENAGLDPNDTASIKEQAELLLELAPKQEWSEEDESMYVRTLGILGKCYMGELPTKVEEELNWFKSIYHKVKLQTTWKPSEEQIKILDEILNFAANHESPYWNYYIFETLNGFIRQLKKLKA